MPRRLVAAPAVADKRPNLWGIRMYAVVHLLETLVVAMAVAAFAHFGVTLKDVPCPRPEQAVRRLHLTAASQTSVARATPCPLAKGLARA